MAIKVTELVNTDGATNTYKVTAFADVKSDVDDGTEPFVGLPRNATIERGSMVITADGDVAFMKSDGTWNWVE